MLSEATPIEAALGHLNAGRLAEARDAYVAAIRAQPQDEQAWLGLALALGLGGALGDLLALAQERERALRDGFLFFHAALGVLMTYRLHAQIHALADHLPEAHPFAASAAYHAGCAALLDGQEDRAFAWFAAFKRRIAGREAALPIGPESHFNVAFRQGTLIEDHEFTEALGEAELPPTPLPEFAGPARRGRGPVLAAAADRHYFALFAAGLARSVAQAMPEATLHLHVIDPDDGSLVLYREIDAAWPGLALNLSTEPAAPYHSGAYYASSRFLIGPALIERYGGRLVLLDLDIELMASLDPLLAACDDAGLALFRHDGPGPCSRHPAVLTVWDARGLDLLDRVGRLVRAKLGVRWPFNWMLDQAALASGIRWARVRRPDIPVAILNERTGGHFQPWLTPLSHEAKEGLIRAAGIGRPGTR